MNKVMSYVERISSIMYDLFPDVPRETIRQMVLDETKQKERELAKNPNAMKFKVEFPNDTPTLEEVSITKIEKILDTDKPIITKRGNCFYLHEEKEATLGQMLSYLYSKRKAVKKEAFTHINDEDLTEMIRLDNVQKTIKILMNSFYGVLNAIGSIFYSPECAASITSMGENIIMTAISIFERFLTCNMKFYSISDIIQYCKNIIDEPYEVAESYEHSFNIITTVDDLYGYLTSHIYNEIQQKVELTEKNEFLYNYLKMIAKKPNGAELLSRIYYKNNLMEFLDSYNFIIDDEEFSILDYFEEIFAGEFLDPNSPSEEQKDTLDFLKDVIMDYVYYGHLNFHKYSECHNGERNTVLTVDTDSTFLYLGRYYKFFKERSTIDLEPERKIVTVINTMTYFLTEVIARMYEFMCECANIPVDKRALINMKNEFLINRIMLTRNKKNYAYECIMREGNLIEVPKLEIKGLPIKKVSTNKLIREYFTDLLHKDIIAADYIDYSLIIGKYFKLIDIIKQSISEGKTEYSIPAKVNDKESYEDPMSIKSFRGALMWNTLYPEEELSFPNKLNMFNIEIPNDIEKVHEMIDDYIQDYEYDENEYKIFMKRLDKILNTPEMFKSGIINSFCFPKNLKEFPLYLRPFVNVDKMVADNVNNGSLILDALGINTPKINKNLVPSNFIKF